MKNKKIDNIEQEKNRILEAAYRCFVKKGYADTSVNDIVKEYGKSKGNIYYYFTNKEDIFFELLKKWHREIFEMIDTERKNYTNVRDFVKDFIAGALNHFIERRMFFTVKIQFSSLSIHNKKLKENYCAAFSKWGDVFKPFRKEFKSARHFESFFRAFFCTLDGILLEYMLFDDLITTQFIKETQHNINLILEDKIK